MELLHLHLFVSSIVHPLILKEQKMTIFLTFRQLIVCIKSKFAVGSLETGLTGFVEWVKKRVC